MWFALALAALPIPVQGTLTDAAGTPLQGPQNVTFRVYRGAVDGSADLTSPQTVTCLDGAFATLLPDLGAGVVRTTDDLWLTVEVAGVESGPTAIGSAPRAAWARWAGGLTTTDPVSVADVTSTGVFTGVTGNFSGALTAASAALAGAIEAGALTLTGALTAGSATISGQLRGGTLVSDGAISGASATVTGQLRGGTVVSDGAISGASATVTGQLRGGSVVSDGAVSGTTGTFSGAVSASQVTLTDAPTATNHAVTLGYLNTALSGYVTPSGLSGYATTASLASYATTASLANYATTASLGGYLPLGGGTLTGTLGGTNASFSGNLGVTGAATLGSLTVNNAATVTGSLTTGASVRNGNTFEYHTSGSSSTTGTWEIVFDAPTQAYYEVEATFSHCGGGCHWAYRRIAFWVNAYDVLVAMEDVSNNGTNAGAGTITGGSWEVTRVQTNSGSPVIAGRFRVRKLPGTGGAQDYGGPVLVRVTGNQPVTVASRTN